MDKYLQEENLRWKQRAKQRWLRERDGNTKFYHTCENHRRKVNTIKRIIDEEGLEATTQEEINFQFHRFYKYLFTTSQPEGIEECLRQMDSKIIEDMNSYLLRKFTH